MLTDQFFKDVLSNYQISPNLWEFFRDELREPIENAITAHFIEKPKFQYGGSLAKGTANSNSCDVDLLVYFDSDCLLSVANIYNEVVLALSKAHFLFEKKNSAISVYGKDGANWEGISVDVVPGKYSSAGDEKDVYLYCHKDGSRLKSNPEKQINKIKVSSFKPVIRLIKLLRHTHGFKFKSFFLELFAVDIVEANLPDNISLTEKTIQFAKKFSEIGVTKVYDPANPNGNDIMSIHTEEEFKIIRDAIKEFYEVLLTDDENLVKDYLIKSEVRLAIQDRIDFAYQKSAKSHSSFLRVQIGHCGSPCLSMACRIKGTEKYLYDKDIIDKGVHLRFEVIKSSYYEGYNFNFIISNAGYEARMAGQPRGGAEPPDKSISDPYKFIKEEHTAYNGNHYVQAIATCPGKESLYSAPFIVRIRDFK